MATETEERLVPAVVEVPEEPVPRGWWARGKHLVLHRILKLDDTPHRIAFGVFLGFLVGATPTLGFQMIIYLGIAAILGANKISGILPIWLSNPVTAVPLYYSNWKIGRLLLTGDLQTSESSKRMIETVIAQTEAPAIGVTHTEFWQVATQVLVDMGLELWVGSLFVGLVAGGVGYWLTYRAVRLYRERRHRTA